MVHTYTDVDVKWVGLELRLNSGRLLGRVEPELAWAGLYRVWTAHDGRVSDLVNLTRAKDAARVLSLRHLSG